MKSLRFFIIWIFLIILNIIVFFYDGAIVKFIASHRNFFLDNFLFILAFDYYMLFLLIILTAIFLNFAFKNKKNCWVVPMWIAIIISYFLSHLLSYFIIRQRPFVTYNIPILKILFYNLSRTFFFNHCFPCYHTLVLFSVLPVINKNFPKLKWFWFIFAITVSFSRFYFGANYLSDLIAGALIGYLIGYLAVLSEEKFRYGIKTKLYITGLFRGKK